MLHFQNFSACVVEVRVVVVDFGGLVGGQRALLKSKLHWRLRALVLFALTLVLLHLRGQLVQAQQLLEILYLRGDVLKVG